MIKFRSIFGFMILICISSMMQAQSIWPKIHAEAHPWTRWWWLGNAVDSAGIAYQLQALHDAGFGGVEITPIYGVNGFEKQEIPYLSKRWMDMLHYTIQKAHQLGMEVDMNNGTGWPFGGPQIPLDFAASKVIFQSYVLHGGERLSQKIIPEDVRQQRVAKLQALMAFSDDGEKIDITDKVDSSGILHWQAPAGNWRLIAVFNGKTFQKVKRAAPGGEGWVMDHFSDTALQIYLNRFAHAFYIFQTPLPHSFFNDSYEVFGADWTTHMFEAFQRLRGYDLRNYLPALLGMGNPDTVQRVIMDYRQTLADLLLHDFAEPWTAWAHRMGRTTRYQAHGSPGNWIDLYASADIPETESFGSCHFDIPGIPEDSLGMRAGQLDERVLKFASSAAHISGKPYASSETFTWLGEHFRVSLAQCKPVLDEMWISGINHVFFHGTPYSPQNAPWPGWQFYASVNFSPYNPIWHDLPAMNQYITRTQSFLQQGKPDNDILLYWPVQDVWARQNPELLFQLTIGNTRLWLDSTGFGQVADTLIRQGYSFDYISDQYIEKTTVENGKLKTPGGYYKVLIIPPCTFIPLHTFAHILSLIKNGGKVVFISHFPENVPGLQAWKLRKDSLEILKNQISSEWIFHQHEVKNINKGFAYMGENISTLLSMAGVEAESMAHNGLSFIRRKTNDGYVYFISNLSSDSFNGWIKLSIHAPNVVIYDAYANRTGIAKLKQVGNAEGIKTTDVYIQIPSGYSYILKTTDKPPVHVPAWTYFPVWRSDSNNLRIRVALENPWTLQFIEGSPEIKGIYCLQRLGSWTDLNDSARTFEGTAQYQISFRITPEQKSKANQWILKLGQVDFSAKVILNGHDVATLWAVPFICDVTPYIRAGENVLQIQVTNLAANRIAAYDRNKIPWKIFKDVNVVNMQYRPLDASKWGTVASGLIGPVWVEGYKNKNNF
ncbi:MAG: glycosyl hydrolase family 2 [Thermoflavifilum aggregans]|nr:glycosyl hydrolase family 2 [Thermoflavifilum aggregans]